MRNLPRTARWLTAALLVGLAVWLAGCTATDAMWYDNGGTYSAGYVYTRPGTSVYYYDYGYPNNYYYPYGTYSYPYSYYNFGLGYYGGHRGHERFEHHGTRGSYRGTYHGGSPGRGGGHHR